MTTKTMLIGAMLAGVMVAPGLAQPQPRVVIPGEGQGTLTLFERPNFGGAAVTFRSAEDNVRVPFVVRSIRSEGDWRLCPEVNLRGNCVLVRASYPDTVRELDLRAPVRSVAPRQGGGGGRPGNWSGPVTGATLRGTTAQFWAIAEIARRPINACPDRSGSADCVARQADRFCDYAGWRRAANHAQVTIGGRNVLADVLCTNR